VERGAYDPEANLVLLRHRQPGADWDGRNRLGDNLYSDSVVALDADTGALKWHYQFTPHDELDYDSTQVPLLADVQWQGPSRARCMLWANRNGVMYVLDRVDRRVPQGQAVRENHLARRVRRKGRPNRVKFPTPEGTLIRPHVHGGTNWAPPSFSPRTGCSTSRRGRTRASSRSRGQFPRTASSNTQQTAMGQTNLVPFFNDDTEPYGVVRPTTRRRSARCGNSG
jgi:glucose dehydrogenase